MSKHHRSDFYIFFIIDAVCGIFCCNMLVYNAVWFDVLLYYGFLEEALMVQYFHSTGILY